MGVTLGLDFGRPCVRVCAIHLRVWRSRHAPRGVSPLVDLWRAVFRGPVRWTVGYTCLVDCSRLDDLVASKDSCARIACRAYIGVALFVNCGTPMEQGEDQWKYSDRMQAISPVLIWGGLASYSAILLLFLFAALSIRGKQPA